MFLDQVPSVARRVVFENPSILSESGVAARFQPQGILQPDHINHQNEIRFLRNVQENFFPRTAVCVYPYSKHDTFHAVLATDAKTYHLIDLEPWGNTDYIRRVPTESLHSQLFGNTVWGNFDRDKDYDDDEDEDTDVYDALPFVVAAKSLFIAAQDVLGKEVTAVDSFSFHPESDTSIIFREPDPDSLHNGAVISVKPHNEPIDPELKWIFHSQIHLPWDDQELAESLPELVEGLREKSNLTRALCSLGEAAIFHKAAPTLPTDEATLAFHKQYHAIDHDSFAGIISEKDQSGEFATTMPGVDYNRLNTTSFDLSAYDARFGHFKSAYVSTKAPHSTLYANSLYEGMTPIESLSDEQFDTYKASVVKRHQNMEDYYELYDD
jgi:hypothetical protein